MKLTPRCKNCGKQIGGEHLKQQAVWGLFDYYFCDEHCLAEFERKKWTGLQEWIDKTGELT